MSKHTQTFFGIAITLAALGWIVATNDWAQVFSHLKGLAYWPFVIATVLIIIQFGLRGLRWRFLLPRGTDITTRTAAEGVVLGNFANYILPLRAGEIVRVFFIKKKGNVAFGTGAVSVLTERVLDVVSVLIAFAITTTQIEEIDETALQASLVLGGIAVALGAGLFAAAFLPVIIQRIGDFFFSVLPGKLREIARDLLKSVINGATALRDRKNLVGSLLSSVAVWVVTFVIYYFYLFLFPEAPALFLFAVLASVLIGLAIAIPSAPGGVGVYQVGCIAALTMGPYDQELATAYALVTHFHQYIVIVACGIYVVAKENISLKGLQGEPTA